MKQSIAYRLSSIILAILVLLSTLSFTVEKHYCGGHLVDVAVFSNVKKCGGLDADMATYVKKPCCNDTIDIIEGQDQLKTIDFQDLDLDNQILLTAYVHSIGQLFESLPKQIIPHIDYAPPNLVKDIQVLDEIYLI